LAFTRKRHVSRVRDCKARQGRAGGPPFQEKGLPALSEPEGSDHLPPSACGSTARVGRPRLRVTISHSYPFLPTPFLGSFLRFAELLRMLIDWHPRRDVRSPPHGVDQKGAPCGAGFLRRRSRCSCSGLPRFW